MLFLFPFESSSLVWPEAECLRTLLTGPGSGQIVPNSRVEKGVNRMQDRCLIKVVREQIEINSAQQAGEYLLHHVYVPFDQFEQEEFWVFPLNARHCITHQVMVYRGTIDMIQVRQAELFRTAVRLNAWGLLMAHNHPSGSALPSDDDCRMYQATLEAGALLGIEVVDHIVVGRQAWTSLREIHPSTI